MPVKDLSPREFAEQTGHPERTVRHWCSRRQIECRETPGGQYRIPVTEVDRWRRAPRERSAA
jgi:excisionase family DNA binding protein